MASSQVEIVPSSPFGCVLRDRNHQQNGYRTREKTTNAFHKDSTEPGHSRFSDHSNSHQHNDYADLWVHNPQGNNDENNQKKSNSGGKCDRPGGDRILVVERTSDNCVPSAGPVGIPPRGRSQDGAQSMPVSRVRSPEPSRPVSSASLRRRSLEGGASSGPASTSQMGKSQSASTSQSQNSVEIPNLGAVSSLVQKWKKYERKRTPASCSSKCNSGMVSTDNAAFVEGPATRGFDSCDEEFVVDIGPGTPRISEVESNGDCESVGTFCTALPGRDSDATEKERIRVADIIRKLSTNREEHNDQEHAVCHESLPHVQTSVDHAEQKSFSPVLSSPRIRGRQAFSDFHMLMERERHKELEGLAGYKAASKFSHRGRIQAMLRVRFLHRGAEVKDGRPPKCTSSNSNGLKQSAIMQLRKIFSLGARLSDTRCPQAEVVDCSRGFEKVPIPCRQSKENPEKQLTEPINPPTTESDTSAEAEGSLRSISVERDKNHECNNIVEQSAARSQSCERQQNHQEVPQLANPPIMVSKGSADTASSLRLMTVQGDMNNLESNSTMQNSENLYLEASSGTGDIQQRLFPDSYNQEKPKFPVAGTSCQNIEVRSYAEFQDSDNQQPPENGNESINEPSQARGDWEKEKDYNHHLGCIWVSDSFDQMSGLEDLQTDYQQELEYNHDWVHDVSRPRSTWEDLRQARYQEMLDPFIDKDDIRHLLQRKSVSSFLSSGMRENIDRLMMSRTQQISRTDQLEGGCELERRKEEKDQECGGEDKYEQNNEEEAKEEDSTDYSDDYEDREHEIQCGQHNVPKSYINQTTSWVMGDDYSDQTASPCIEQTPFSNVSTLETQQSMNRHSIEMELIYQLKGNMEQLHQEVSELRRSIKSCADLQMELQQSIKQDITAALCQSGKQNRRGRRGPSRGRCCICYEVQIDSLLYRCGHMCTCFNCAHELQCSSGRCPVCQAPIIDVVRAYAQS